MKDKKQIFISVFAYLVIFVAGFVFVCFAWMQSLTFQQGSFVESPYFLLALFSTFVIVLFSIRFILGFYSKWRKDAADDGVGVLQNEEQTQGEKANIWLPWIDFSKFLGLALLYGFTMYQVNFFLCTFLYLLIQSLWLRRRMFGLSDFLCRPKVWFVHLVYAGIETLALSFLVRYIFMIGL